MLEKKNIGNREIERKKKLASKFKGINYDVKKNLFTVRVRCGTDLNGRPLYVQPIRSYNEIEKAVDCLNLYNEMVANGMGRHKKITFEIIKKELETEKKQLLTECKANPESKIAMEGKAKIETLKQHISALDYIKRGAPLLFVKDLRKIENGEIQKACDQIYKSGIKSLKGNKNVSKKTLNERFIRLKTIIGDKYGIDCNLFRVKKLSEGTKDTNIQLSRDSEIYSIEELNKLYCKITELAGAFRGKNNTAERTRMLLILLICTGARIGELLNISVDKVIHKNNKLGYIYNNIDGKREVLRLDGLYYIVINRQSNDYTRGESLAKTPQSNRVIPICKELYDEMQLYIEKYNLVDDDKLFFSSFSSDNKKISMKRNNAWDYIIKLQEEAEIEHVEGRAIHKFRDTLITKLESILRVRENTVRFFVGHKGRTDAHSGYLKLGGDTLALKLSALEFVTAQTAYFYSVVYNFSAEKMINLNKALEEWRDKTTNDMSISQIRDEYTNLYLNNEYGRIIEAFGYGEMADRIESEDYNIHCYKIEEALEDYYTVKSVSFRAENNKKDYVGKWMKAFYDKIDESDAIDSNDHTMEWTFYNSKDDKFRAETPWKDFLLDIKDENSVLYEEFQEFLFDNRESES